MSGDGAPGSVLSGETWRPTPLSAWLAVLLTVGFAAWVGADRGLLVPVGAAVVAAAVAAVAVGVAAGDRPRHALAGSLLLVAAAGGFAGSLAFATVRQPLQRVTLPVLPPEAYLFFPTGAIVVVLAFFGTFGAVLGVRDRLDARTTGAANGLLAFTVLPVGAVAALSFLDFLAPLGEVTADLLAGVGDVYAGLLEPVAPGLAALVGLVVAGISALLALLLADPLSRFDAERLPRYRRYRPRLLSLLVLSWVALLAVDFVLLAVPPTGLLEHLAELPEPLEAVLLALGTSSLVRWVLVWGSASAAAAAAVTVLGRRLAQLDRWTLARDAGRLSGAGVLVGGVTVGLGHVDHRALLAEVLARNPGLADTVRNTAPGLLSALRGERGGVLLFALTLGALLVPLCVWWGVVVQLYVSLSLRLQPSRAGGHALAALCTFGLAVAATLVGAGPIVLFGGVALAFVVWDLGEFAVGVGEEVGRLAWTTHGELVHAGAAFGLGAVAVGATVALSGLAGDASADQPGGLVVVALLASIAGVALLSAAARN